MKIVPSEKINIDSILLLLILFIGTILRFYNLSGMPFMNDELSAVVRCRFDNFHELIRTGVLEDVHPAGIQVFMYYWIGWFGEAEWVVKLPFLLFGIASIYLVYIIGKCWFNSSVGLISAAFLSVMQYHVMYSQLARPYSSGLFLTLLMIWFWGQVLFTENRKWLNAIGLGVFAALCAYNHYFSLLFMGIVGLSGIFFFNKQNRKQYISAFSFAALLYLPHLSIFLHHISVGGVGWLGPPTPAIFMEYLSYILHFSIPFFALFFAVVAGGLVIGWGAYKKNMRSRILSLLWFIVPIIISYLYSINVSPVMQFSVLLFSFPFFLFALLSFYKELGNIAKCIVVVLICAIGTTSLIYERNHYTTFYQQGFEQVAKKAKEISEYAGNDGYSLLVDINVPQYIHYYLDKYEVKKTCDLYQYHGGEQQKELRAMVKKLNTNYLLLGIIKPAYMELIPYCKEIYPYLVDYEYGAGYMYFCFSKIKPEQTINLGISKKECHFSNVSADWKLVPSSILFDSASQSNIYRFDSLQEYGLTYESKVVDVVSTKHDLITISALIKLKNIPSKAFLVLSIEDDAGSVIWKGMPFYQAIENCGDWTRVFQSMKFSDFKIQDDWRLKVYIWNKEFESFDVKDISIEVEKGNELEYSLFQPFTMD